MHVSSTYNKGNKIISRLLASILVVFGGVSCSNENSANSNCAAYSLPVTYSIGSVIELAYLMDCNRICDSHFPNFWPFIRTNCGPQL